MSRLRLKRWRTWLEPRAREQVDSYMAVTRQPWASSSIELKVSDCNHYATLYFYPERLQYSLDKLGRAREALDKVEEFLLETNAELEARKREKEEQG